MCVREGEVGRDALRACDRPFDVSQKSLTDLAFFSGGGGATFSKTLPIFRKSSLSKFQGRAAVLP